MIPMATPRRKSVRTASTRGRQSRTTGRRDDRRPRRFVRRPSSAIRHPSKFTGYAPCSAASAANSNAIAAWPSKLTCLMQPDQRSDAVEQPARARRDRRVDAFGEHLGQQLALGRAVGLGSEPDHPSPAPRRRRAPTAAPAPRVAVPSPPRRRPAGGTVADAPRARNRTRRPAGTRHPRSFHRCRSRCRPTSRPAPGHRPRFRPGMRRDAHGGAGRGA